MPAPKRLSRPRRLNASPAAGMFPHTVTLYNVAVETDKTNIESAVVNHITLLKGVLVDATKGVNTRESGLIGADSVIVYVPFDVEAADAVTGEPKKYMPPVEFWRTEDRSKVWTFAISAKGSGLDGYTFFVKGVALPPETDKKGNPLKPELVAGVVEGMYDHVYNITKIDEKDFGGLKHWEIGGN